MALNRHYCANVPLRNCSLTQNWRTFFEQCFTAHMPWLVATGTFELEDARVLTLLPTPSPYHKVNNRYNLVNYTHTHYLVLLLLLLSFYRYYTGQPVLAGTPTSWELEDSVGAKFYCRHAVANGNWCIRLRKTRYSSSERCYLHRLQTASKLYRQLYITNTAATVCSHAISILCQFHVRSFNHCEKELRVAKKFTCLNRLYSPIALHIHLWSMHTLDHGWLVGV